ncbi:MAG: deoxyribose-phosphate aldolase [Candidatus Zixiibacteriota bacterium]
MPDILENLNRRFDHAALQQEAAEDDIRKLCREARKYDFYSVAINPVWVGLAREELQHTPVKILSVSGFPLGAHRTDIKIAEAVKGVSDGAHEIDMVANIAWLVSGQFKKAENEIAEIRKNLPYNIVLKVIIEAGKLTPAGRVDATRAVVNGGAQFVKTCTGFFGGAAVEQVRDLFNAARGEIKVKASGGIRSLQQCRQLLEAGATRLGSSSSTAILNELKNTLKA